MGFVPQLSDGQRQWLINLWLLDVMNRSFVFGERAVISLFRGAGGLLGSAGGGGASGIDTLNAQLEEALQDYFWSSQVFDSYEGDVFNFREVGSQQALAFVNQFDRVAALGAVGYSAGGLSAIRLVNGLAPAAVNLLVQIDSFDPLTGSSREDEILPANGVKGINYFQVANRFNPFQPGFDPFDLQGATVVQGSEPINVESLLGDRGITHRTIVNDPRVQGQILQDIETYVLQDLKFDRQGQISLTGGAQLRNNILSLVPGGDGAAGTALIAEEFAIAADFSFQTRFEFRLPPTGAGFSFWLRPEPLPGQALSSLAITFEPFTLQTQSTGQGAIALLTPSFSQIPLIQAPLIQAPLIQASLIQANTGLDLASGNPLTAWIDYNGSTDQLSVFLADTLTQPTAPLLTYGLTLPDIVGSRAFAGFQTTTSAGEGQADLLTWDFTATGGLEPPPMRDIVAQKRLPFDYNGDGQADFAFFRALDDTGSGAIGELGVWLLDGLSPPLTQGSVGTFPLQAPGNPLTPALALRNLDFNGDGKTDVLFSQPLDTPGGGFELSVWEMDGTALVRQATIASLSSEWENPITTESFAPRLPLSSFSQGAFGDFNGDRKTDLLFLQAPTASGRRDLALWLMDGTTPTAQTVIDTLDGGWLPFNLNDFNGDGQADILFERTLSDGAREYGLWLMDGIASTARAAIGSVVAGADWSAIATNDFNGGGKADILFTRTAQTTPDASTLGASDYALWLMDGTTPLEQTAIGSSGEGWRLVDHNDFNGDGKADLLFNRAVANHGEQYGLWLMDGPSFWAQAEVGTATDGWQYLGSADINGDGKADLTFANEATKDLAGWLMNGTAAIAKAMIGAYDDPASPAGWQPPFTTSAIASP